MSDLRLRVTDYESDTVWRWVLEDRAGKFLADHEVELDRSVKTARSFRDLPGFLKAYEPIETPEALLDEAGAWIGKHVFGSLAARDQQAIFKEGLESLPPEIVAAFESGNPETVQTALQALPHEEQQAVMAKLQELARAAGSPQSTGPDMAAVLKNFAPLLHGIAAVARGDDSPREQIETALPQLEQNGWQLTDAVHRIWAGERDAAALTADVDSNSAQLVEHILKLIELPSREELLAGLPEPVRQAIVAGDEAALKAALAELPEEEAKAIVERFTSG